MKPSRRVSLTIGATGMLAAATRWLAERSLKTIVISRQAPTFAKGRPEILPVQADWTAASFRSAVSREVDQHGPVDQALLWLHDPDPTLGWLMPLLASARIVLVLGSMDGAPSDRRLSTNSCTVRLGSKPTATGRRWLSDEEISAAAIASMEDGRSRVVGDLLFQAAERRVD